MTTSGTRTAVVLGATGLVGGHVLDVLLRDPAYRAVTTLGRRPSDRDHPALTHHVVDFERLGAHADLFEAQDVFCCLGTTMKQAGSREAFYRVDVTYVRDAAGLALGVGAEQFLLVSSQGASPRSPFFYSRVKGEAEAAVTALPFEGTYVFRPSLLTGARDEERTGERVAETVLGALSFLLRGPLSGFRPIPARSVAEAMVQVARTRPGGVQVYEVDVIRGWAARYRRGGP